MRRSLTSRGSEYSRGARSARYVRPPVGPRQQEAERRRPVSLLGISPDAWSAAAGAVVGGSFTLFAQITNDRNQAKAAKKAAEDQAAATAILLQDDFWHYQSMLARALDRCTWWKPSEVLPAQAT